MASSDTTLISEFIYYSRNYFYGNALATAIDSQRRYGNDSTAKLFRGLAHVGIDKKHEALKELSSLASANIEVSLGANLGMLIAQKQFGSAGDRDEIGRLEQQISEIKRTTEENALFFGGLALYILKEEKEAKPYLERAAKSNNHFEALSLLGWVELKLTNDIERAARCFEEALKLNGSYIDALFGHATCLQAQSRSSDAQEAVDRVLVKNKDFLPAVIEKMKLKLADKDWEQMIEVANRCLDIDDDCIEAMRYKVLYSICKESSLSLAAQHLGKTCDIINKREGTNFWLYLDTARLFSRICGRNSNILEKCEGMLVSAGRLRPKSIDVFLERGRICLMKDKSDYSKSHDNINDALSLFESGKEIDSSDVDIIIGILKCHVLKENYDQAESQLNFLKVSTSGTTAAQISFLRAQIAKGKLQKNTTNNNNLTTEKVVRHYEETLQEHFASVKKILFGKEFIQELNADFVMEVIGQILEFAPPRPVEQGQRPSALLQKCVTSLEQLIQVLPGYQDALFMVSQVRFLSGDREGAKLLLAQTLERENGFVPAHVLLAQIHLASDDYAKVEQSLQDALSSNFHLKSHPLFMLIRTRVFKEQNRLTDAGQLIEQALSSAEVKKNGTSVIGGLPLREQDKADLYLELVDIRLLQKDFINAEEAVNHAVQRFKGTGEEARILIKNVDLTLSRGNTDVAINMLKRIQSNQTYYVDARERLARIYLEKKNDKNAYINTYLELDEQSSEPYTKILCGDAYMKIVQPGKAIKMYETALKKNPRDSLLAKKIGGALVKAHNYGKAISYYEVAIKIGHMDELRYDLANLFFKLDQLREADKVINTALEHDDPNITNLICQTKCLKLSSEIIGQKGNIEKQLMYMEKALQRQDRVIKKAQMMSSDQLPLYNQMAADLCKDIGILFERVRNFDSAIKMYKEAIVYSDMDSQAHLLLAKAYLAQNNLDRCRQVVYTLLKRDESNVEAKMLNANVQFRKGEADAALTDFQKILEKKSDNYIALQTLVVLMYHAGRIEDVSQFIATTEKMNPRCRDDAGFNYAHGLYHKLGCNPTEALINFNHCRQDKEYIRQAVVQMAQICLNRDNEIHASPADEERFTSKGKFDSNLLAQETAANLLASIDDKDNDIPYQVTRAYCLMHLKKADDTKQALVNLEELLEKHPNNVSIQVARSEALQHLNKNREALEILENLEQIQWNPTDADDIEKAWLKLAFQYFSDGDIEQCRKLCERVLEFNKCNTKAYEYLGQMMQQKKNYIEAAKYYEMAWKFGRKNQPQVGYSLALNYLQAERYTDCIDTCNYVSENHKDLRKKIQTEILTKARERLRT